MRIRLVTLLTALMAFTLGAPLHAANLVVNGDFELLNMTSGNAVHSTIIGNGMDGLPTSTGWRTTGGYNFIMVDNPGYVGGPPQSLTGADDFADLPYADGAAHVPFDGGRFGLWGPDYPGSASGNDLRNSPVGGSFLAADGSYLNRPVEQTIAGLTPGTTYYLSFYWAAAQQSGLFGDTKEAWIMCIGTCSYTANPVDEGLSFFNADPGNTDPADPRANLLGGYNASLLYDPMTNPTGVDKLFKTSVVTNPEGNFTPWRFESFSFTATTATTTLSLLAYGTPPGQPPFALIDGISIDTIVPVPVLPEPTTWAMMLIGFGVIGGVMRTRRHSASGLGAQIV